MYSTTLDEVAIERTRIERTFDPVAIRKLKAESERDITVDGPTLAARAIRAGLVDEYQLIVGPAIVGGGNRFFPDDVRVDLELLVRAAIHQRCGLSAVRRQGRSMTMGKVLWHTMMSLDGFIAGPNDDVQWAFDIDSGPSQTIDEIVRSTGALLVGRRTQDVEDRLQPGFYGGAYGGPFFVLRHGPPSEPPVVKGVTGQFLDASIEEAMTLAKEAAKEANVGILGANVARQCLGAGLLDEIIIHVAPVLLGDGVRLFDRSGGTAVRLEPISSQAEGEMTVLRYRVGSDAA